jgi:hypothetical protein
MPTEGRNLSHAIGPAGIPNCKMTQNKPSKEDQKTKFPYCWSEQEGYINNPGSGGTDLNYCLNYPRPNKGYWVPICHDVPMNQRPLFNEQMPLLHLIPNELGDRYH